jgi:uncharacterized protein (TIGR01244 family)
MEEAKKVSDDLSIAGQPDPQDLKAAAEQGFKSVLNLRSPEESGALPNEQSLAEAAGLAYANVPLSSTTPNEELVNQALLELESLAKPVLVHCGVGLRAGAIGLIATAIEQNWTLEQLTQKAEEIGLSLEQAHLKQFIQQHYRDQTLD